MGWESWGQSGGGGGGVSGLSDNLPSLTLGGTLVDPVYLAGARGICAVDSYAYVAVWEDGAGQTPVDGDSQGRFAVIDVTGDEPVLMASIQHADIKGARGVDVAGEVVALVCSLNGGSLLLIDVTRKKSPVVVGTSTDSKLTGAHRVIFDGRWVYVTGLNYFTIWDCADPTTPTLVGSLDVTGDDIYGMAIKGDTAFLAASASNKYHAVDISDRANPTIISSITLAGSGPHWPTIDGKLMYTANSGTDSVDILDVSDPTAMTVVGSVSDSRLNGCHTLAKLGSLLLVCSQSYSGFGVVDATNPAAPTVAGSVTDNSVMDGVRSMYVVGTRCYWAAPGPQATPFTTGSVGWLDLNGLDVATARIGSARIDEGEVRGRWHVGSLTAHSGAVIGPNGVTSRGPIVAQGQPVVLDDDARLSGGGGATSTADVFDASIFGKAVSSNGFSTFTQLSSRYNGGSRKTSVAPDAEVVFRLHQTLRAGTWTIVLLQTQTTDRGIHTIATSPDGTTWTDLTTIDGYAAALTQARSEVAGLAMPAGVNYLRLKMSTKNASSSSYNSEISGLYGLRTGA